MFKGISCSIHSNFGRFQQLFSPQFYKKNFIEVQHELEIGKNLFEFEFHRHLWWKIYISRRLKTFQTPDSNLVFQNSLADLLRSRRHCLRSTSNRMASRCIASSLPKLSNLQQWIASQQRSSSCSLRSIDIARCTTTSSWIRWTTSIPSWCCSSSL